MVNDFFMTDEDDLDIDIEFSELKKEKTIFVKKEVIADDGFLSALREEYNTNSSLLDNLNDLVEESEDKDKLIDILNSL